MTSPSDVFQRSFGDPTAARAGAVMLHGLGEHSGRHAPHLALCAKHGIYCRAFDWPGHGQSPGQRGHIGSMATMTKLLMTQMEALRNDIGPNKQIGLFGHSMGGFIALYHLAKYPDLADFTWIGSTLIDPETNASPLKRRLARLLHAVCPRFPIKSGIRSSQCCPGPDKRRDPLMHKCITVRLGIILLEAARELQTISNKINPNLRMLMTHGGADPICSPLLAQTFFERLVVKAKTFRLLEDVLHEPFHAETRNDFHATLEQWIEHELSPHLDKRSFAKSAI